jgi:hypothetical protein
MLSIINKLALKYFQLTGHSPEYSFWSWLDAIGAGESEEALEEIYNNIKEYI